MKEQEFEQFLYHQIPMTKAMDITVKEFSPSKVVVSAKLEPNKNHKSTAFGGSINSLMTVCGWSMVYTIIKGIDPDAHIVIHKSNIEYIAPVVSDFTAECELSSEDSVASFIKMYEKRKKARIKLNVSCYCDNKLCAKYEGEYVSFR